MFCHKNLQTRSPTIESIAQKCVPVKTTFLTRKFENARSALALRDIWRSPLARQLKAGWWALFDGANNNRILCTDFVELLKVLPSNEVMCKVDCANSDAFTLFISWTIQCWSWRFLRLDIGKVDLEWGICCVRKQQYKKKRQKRTRCFFLFFSLFSLWPFYHHLNGSCECILAQLNLAEFPFGREQPVLPPPLSLISFHFHFSIPLFTFTFTFAREQPVLPPPLSCISFHNTRMTWIFLER